MSGVLDRGQWTFLPVWVGETFQCRNLGKSQLHLKTLPFPCLIIFHSPTSHPPPPPPLPLSSLLFSHSLSGRAICEGPVQHHSAPAEASSSSGYNSEWISISSGHWIRMSNLVQVAPPLFPWCCLCVAVSTVAPSRAGVAFACCLAVSAWQVSHTRIRVCGGKWPLSPVLHWPCKDTVNARWQSWVWLPVVWKFLK